MPKFKICARRGRSAVSLVLAGSLALIGAQTLGGVAAAETSDTVPSGAVTKGDYEQPFKPPAMTYYESGVASTYGEGDGFEGNRTACGKIFHTSVVQIAHKSLPCGTHVRIEDVSTGHTVDADVTDRGPYVPGRVVDLSWGAFRELDPSGPGLLHVNLYVLNE